LIDQCRSAELFFREQAEGELRQYGIEALPVIARSLDDPDQDLRLRLWGIFHDGLLLALDNLDSDYLALLRDTRELGAISSLISTFPEKITRLEKESAPGPVPEKDPDREREILAERAAKAQELRAAREALRDARARLPDIESRIPEQKKRLEEGQKRILALGVAAVGPISCRRESVLIDVIPYYEILLNSIRSGLAREEIIIPADRAGKRNPRDAFESKRYLLSSIWAREIDLKGALAEESAPLLLLHVERVLDDLSSGETLLRQRAEEDLYALGPRGLLALKGGVKGLSKSQVERLESLLKFRIDPRLEKWTGMDFRGFSTLPFRARRQLVIHYARVAGRDAIPTLRQIALDEKLEPSLRVRLAAAEALAGSNIRDLSAIRTFQKRSMPELLKIPQIARDFAIINGTQLTSEKRYAEAVEEFRKILEEAPYDFQANYRIAFAYLLMKNYGKAILHFEIARRVQPGDSLTLYNLSCAYSLDGQVNKALETLEASVKAGFTDYEHMERDPDLAPLRESPRYYEIIDRLKGDTGGSEKGRS